MKVAELLGLAQALPKDEQHELLNQLHDSIYRPTYAPRPAAYATVPPSCAAACSSPCAGAEQLRAA